MNQNQERKNRCIILVGPSGGGKSCMSQYLVATYEAESIVSDTSRIPRVGEIPDVDYYFRTQEEMLQMIENQEFVEYSMYASAIYGTSKKELESKMDAALSVNVMEITGARKIKEMYPDTVLIFCKCPVASLMYRMRDRGDSFDNIVKRVSQLVDNDEFANEKYCDYVIDNSGTLEDAYAQDNFRL